jgi:hypothetical protein
LEGNTEEDPVNNPRNSFYIGGKTKLVPFSTAHSPKIKPASMPLDIFWIALREKYPEIARKILVFLLQFLAPYLCT